MKIINTKRYRVLNKSPRRRDDSKEFNHIKISPEIEHLIRIPKLTLEQT